MSGMVNVYTSQNVVCAVIVVFVLSLLVGGVVGWIVCHRHTVNCEKMEIKDHMKYHKDRVDHMKNMQSYNKTKAKAENFIAAEGSMHSQSVKSGGNKVERMHHEGEDDPDRMVVERMEPADLSIAIDRNQDGYDTPSDHRSLNALSTDPDEQLMKSFESPFASWRNSMGAMEGVNWN